MYGRTLAGPWWNKHNRDFSCLGCVAPSLPDAVGNLRSKKSMHMHVSLLVKGKGELDHIINFTSLDATFLLNGNLCSTELPLFDHANLRRQRNLNGRLSETGTEITIRNKQYFHYILFLLHVSEYKHV